jgi:all-trans-8'-apo-beta-carotenal 15,15'-oxygenase
MQIIDTKPFFVFHHSNAFEQDGKVYLDSICYASFPGIDQDTDYKQVDFGSVPEGQLWRFQIDLATQTVEPECLVSRCCEFPGLHPDQAGRPYRYVFMGAADIPQGNAPLQGYMKVDFETGAQQIWSAAPKGFTGEPNFVPRPQATAEDDGWLIGFVYNAERQCTDVVILDGQNLEQGPIARLKLKHHVPYSLHGSFTPICFMPD